MYSSFHICKIFKLFLYFHGNLKNNDEHMQLMDQFQICHNFVHCIDFIVVVFCCFLQSKKKVCMQYFSVNSTDINNI